jgi:hypothetical protein
MDVTLRSGGRGSAALAAAVLFVAAAHPSRARGDEPPSPHEASPTTVGSEKVTVQDHPKTPVTPRPADEPSTVAGANANDAALARIIDRPHTIAELEAGIIALPTAPISAGQKGGNTPFGTIGHGDATIQTGIHVLYRWTRDLAIGAGALFAPDPTSDTEYGGLRSLPRTHARSYLFLGGEGRYVPIHYKFLEAWAGLSAGAVVIADRFTTDAGDTVPSILGTKEVTIRTEGFAFGVQAGGSYYLTENWIAGLNLRAYRWVLPTQPQCSAIGDCATLSGTVEAFELGLTIGYRLPL